MDLILKNFFKEYLKCFDSLLVDISFDEDIIYLKRKLNGAEIIISSYSVETRGNWVLTAIELFALINCWNAIRMQLDVSYQRSIL